MYVKIQIKHLIIPIIVFLITSIVLIYNQYNYINDDTLNITYVFAQGELVNQSEESFVWDALLAVQTDFNNNPNSDKYQEINLNFLKSNSLSKNRLDDLAIKNDVIVIYGDVTNQYLQQVAIDNPQTDFILIDSGVTYNEDNIVQINFNDNELTKQAAQTAVGTTTTNQILYINTVDESDDQYYQTFVTEVLNSNPKMTITYYQVENITNNVGIINELDKYFEQGYDTIFVADSALNQIVIKGAIDYQEQLDQEQNNQNIDTNVSVDSQSQQDNINVITTTYDNYLNGVYQDSNKDGVIDEQDDSVVVASFEKDIYTTLKKEINEIANEEFNNKKIELNFDNNGIIKVP